MRIVLYTGYTKVPWNPQSLEVTGLGGTEQCVLYLAKYLAKDNQVWVVGEVAEGDFDGVRYRQTQTAINELGSDYIDCVIGVSYIHYLKELESLNFKHSMFWVHNTDFYPWHRGEVLPNEGRDLLKDVRMTWVVCLTEWHRNKFSEQFPEASNKICVIGNGVEVNNFVEPVEKDKDSFIYTSHTERGLRKILSEWSEIKKKRPTAKLHIATPEYGLEYFNDNFLDEIKGCDDIEFHGTLSQPKLYKLMSRSEYWYYPTDYEETFCITALEMLGHGVKPIANPIAGLGETLNKFNLSDFEENLDSDSVEKYLKTCSWSGRKVEWAKYICNMGKTNIECIYIIALEHDEDKKKEWAQLISDKLIPGYSGELIVKEGRNGAELSSSWLRERKYSPYGNWCIDNAKNEWWNRPVTPGELGCAISHYEVWEDARKRGWNSTLILEEDFCINSELTPEISDAIPSDWDIFYLGRNLIPGAEDERTESDLIFKVGPSYNAHAYMLSKPGLKKLFEQNFNTYIMPTDEFLICCYHKHPRKDLHFIWDDSVAYGVSPDTDLVGQTRQSADSGPRVKINTEGRLHPELYSYWNSPQEWKERYITYATKTQEWSLIMDEPFDNCFSMPLFTAEFCQTIMEEAEHANVWTTDRHEFYPTTDFLLEAIGMDRIYYEVLREYVMPAAIHAFQLDGKGWGDMASEDFLAKYVPNAQGHLSLHHDHSNITALVTLSHMDDYEGGGTWFSHQKKLVKEQQGCVSIHPGNITHKHGARATTKGKRYIIVSFMKNLHFMKD